MARHKLFTIRRAFFYSFPLLVALGCSGTSGDPNDDDNPQLGTGGLNGDGDGDGGGGVTTGGALNPSTGGSDPLGTGGTIIHPACPGNSADAYLGVVPAIPGVIEAEDFDPAGYFDTTPGNEDGEYRTDVDVDIKVLGDGHAISWFTAGEWLEYTINVTTGGAYAVTAQAGAVEAGRTLELTSCGDSLGTFAVPQVAAWGQIATSNALVVNLAPGVQVIRVTVGPLDYADFDSLTFEPADSTPGSGGAGSGGAGSGGAGTGGMGTGGGLPTLHKFVGNITTNNSANTDGLTFSKYWDQITPENAGKWGSVQGNIANNRNWNTLDALYDYAQSNGIIFKQHVFVWGSQQPSGNITEAHVKAWMNEFCARYPNTPLVEVVNEPPPHTEPAYANNIGGGTNSTWQWIINSFIWAHEACPNSILILNDYNNIEYADQNQHFINIANAVKNAGAPIHAVGAQAHGLHGQYGATTQTMINLITKLRNDTGLPVYVTEYDIGEANDQTQLQKYQEHLSFFLDTQWIHGITLWGWINGKTWISNSGIMNGQNPRPAMTWLMNELGRPTTFP
jgi:GH35 family endo-1,4-beta-xylanase